MLAEFVDRLVGLALQSRTTKVMTDERFPRTAWMVKSDGTFEVMDVPPEDRRHHIESLDSLIEIALDSTASRAPAVFLHDCGIRLAHDINDRREMSTMGFKNTERFGSICGLRDGRSMSPLEAVKMLRFELWGLGADAVLQALRRVDFTRKSSGSASVEHGRETLGRGVEAEIQQTDKIPESFQVIVPVYSNPGIRGFTAKMQIGVYLDVHAEQVELRLLPDEVDKAIQGVMAQIDAALRAGLDDAIPVYHGRL